MENAFDAESRTIPTRTRKVTETRRFFSHFDVSSSASSSDKTSYERIANDLNRQIEAQRSQLEEHQMKPVSMAPLESDPRSTTGRGMTKTATVNRLNLQEQLAVKEEQRLAMVRALADVRSDMMKIAEGNLRALNEEEKQTLSIEALINARTAQLQEKIDDDEKQLLALRQELKKQRTLAQQATEQSTDAREKLSENETNRKENSRGVFQIRTRNDWPNCNRRTPR